MPNRRGLFAKNAVFTRTVFRPDARWAGALVVAASGVLGVQVAFGVARALTASPAQHWMAQLVKNGCRLPDLS